MKIRSVGKIQSGKKSIAKKGMSEYNKKIVDELLPKKKEEGHFTEVDIMSGERWEGKPVDEEAVSKTNEYNLKNERLLRALDEAYSNDLIATSEGYWSEEYLDKLVEQGFLENKHKLKDDSKIQVYWISKKGLDLLKESNQNYSLSKQRKEDLELTQLGQFYGTTQYYNVMGTRVTDGVNYVMDNGYSWLVTDALAVLRTHPKVRGQEFVVVKMVNEANGGCSVRYEDGNGNVLYKQKYDITDAKVDVKMYFENGVLLLPRER
jgi:hypothetical protein